MENRVIRYRDRLLEIAERKCRLLKSVIDQIDHIETNPVFIDEIQEAFMELDEAESEIMGDNEVTIECPSCSFECSQIHSFCMACGNKLPEQYSMLDS